MAFELSTLRSNSKSQLDHLITEMEQAKAVVKHQSEQMDAQREILQKQGAVLQAQGAQMANLEVGAALAHAVQRKEKRIQRFKWPADNPKDWKQHKFVKHGTFGFLQYSSYRTSISKFVTIGMAALKMREDRKFQGCVWTGNDGSVINGDLKFLYSEEHHSMRYEPVILECALKRDTGTNGGYLVGAIDDEEFVMIREEEAQVEYPSTFQYQFTECSPPLFGELGGKSVREWFDYHRVIIGIDHFVLYNVNAVDTELMSYLGDYVDANMIDILDYSDAVALGVWWWGQATAQHDCIYRSRHTSKWITMIDLDEFVEVKAPNSMGALLKNNENLAWFTHGSMWWGIGVCNDRQGDDLWFLERMVYRWPGHYCQNKQEYPDWKFCLDSAGHRKMILNPRKVTLMQIHRVLDPMDGGKHFNAENEMIHHHFQQFNLKVPEKGKERCHQTHKDNDTVDWWVRDTRLADTVRRIKNCPVGDRTCVEKV